LLHREYKVDEKCRAADASAIHAENVAESAN
jgi:hypothetical protein